MVRNRGYEPHGSHGGGNDRNMTEPLFSSSFPAPPRRQAPSLHDISFDEENGATFRQADSSSRALAALAQAKYEQKERRRAYSLIGMLALATITIQGVTGGYFRSAADNIMDFKPSFEPEPEKADMKNGPAKPVRQGGGGGPRRPGGNSTSSGVGTSDAPAMTEEQKAEERFVANYKGYADFMIPREDNDRALYWHIPRAAGTSMKNALGQCLGLVSAGEAGGQAEPCKFINNITDFLLLSSRINHLLTTFQTNNWTRFYLTSTAQRIDIVDVEGMRYVNVDTTTVGGINHAKSIGLAQSGLADVVISPYVMEASTIFNEDFPGRAFTIMRDPIERAVSMYYYRTKDKMDLDVTLEEYAKGQGIENNWMTRYLSGQMEGELTKEKLEQAKVVLRRKFLIGFVDDFQESIYRVLNYNGWEYSAEETEALNQQICLESVAKVGSNQNDDYQMPKRGSQAHALLSWQTQYDMKLYEYAKELFDKQTKIWGSKEAKKKLKKRKKKEKDN